MSLKKGDEVVITDKAHPQYGETAVVTRTSPDPGMMRGDLVVEVGTDGEFFIRRSHVQPAPDVVSHPPHYRDGTPPGIEVIDIIRAHEAAGGTWETLNALKYILRHTLKDNPVQDIRKAIQYLNMWVERQETEAA